MRKLGIYKFHNDEPHDALKFEERYDFAEIDDDDNSAFAEAIEEWYV